MPVLLDCTGLSCPMPLVRMSRVLKELGAGETLVVTARDPAFHADVLAWVRKTGCELVAFEDGPTQTATVRKS